MMAAMSMKRGERGKREKGLTSNGYVRVYQPEHPHAFRGGYVLEHTLVAEKVLGYFLPDEACVHHVDENRANNTPNNLVICEDNAFHGLLHRRMKALHACGHADWRHCWICGGWFAPEDPAIVIKREGRFQHEHVHHLPCRKKEGRGRHAKHRQALADVHAVQREEAS